MITTGWLHNSLLSFSLLAPIAQPVIAMLSHKISSIMIIDNYVALKEWSKSSINHHTLHFELLIVNEDHHFHFLSFLGFKFTSSSAAVLRLLCLHWQLVVSPPVSTCPLPPPLPDWLRPRHRMVSTAPHYLASPCYRWGQDTGCDNCAMTEGW